MFESYSLLSQNHSAFSFKDCCFEVEKNRESTARVVIWKEFNVINSYTCEASFCGPSNGEYGGFHFNPKIYSVHIYYIIGIWQKVL